MTLSLKYYKNLDDYITLIKNNEWIYNIKRDIKYSFDPSLYIDNYIGPKSDILKNDLKLLFQLLDFKFVSIEEFLQNIYNKFDLLLENDDGITNYILFQTISTKSNMWMNMLFLHYLIDKNKLDDFKHRLYFVAKPKTKLGDNLPIQKYTLLYLDDGLYSGQQAGGLINSYKDELGEYYERTIIISYMTNLAKKNTENKPNIYYTIPMKTFDENIYKDKIIEWKNKNKLDKFFIINKKDTLNIFEHKVADNQSIPTNFINNTPVIKGNITPYYKLDTFEIIDLLDFSIKENLVNHLIIPCANPRIIDNTSKNVCYSRYYKAYIINNEELKKFIDNSSGKFAGGYYNKYLKYKSKYLELKKHI